jgi:signal transduction histidine kinase
MKASGVIYLLLLGYIVAALSFWWLSLERQSREIYEKEIAALEIARPRFQDEETYRSLRREIEIKKGKRSKQYLGEGLTFLVVILIGSSVVYTTQRFSARLARQQNNFMLSVTHELKSPIAAIKLTLQTLQRHRLDEERQSKMLSKCVAEADRLNELCNNVLLSSRVEGGQYSGERRTVDLHDLVEQAVQLYSGRYPGRFRLIPFEAPAIIETDPTLLDLVLHNLMENAVKYTPADSPVELQLLPYSGKWGICVRDRGLGIPDAEKKKIFAKFYRVGNEETRKTKGTGLGLYLSWKIVRQLGGSIFVRDREGGGSIFEIQLPV